MSQAALGKDAYGSIYETCLAATLLVLLLSIERDVRLEKMSVVVRHCQAHACFPELPCPCEGKMFALSGAQSVCGHPAGMSTKRNVRLLNSWQRVQDRGTLQEAKLNIKLSLQSKPCTGSCTFPGGAA